MLTVAWFYSVTNANCAGFWMMTGASTFREAAPGIWNRTAISIGSSLLQSDETYGYQLKCQ